MQHFIRTICLLVGLLCIAVGVGVLCVTTSQAAPQAAPTTGTFNINQVNPAIPPGEPGYRLWRFVMSRDPLQDLPITAPEDNRGFTRWMDGDRIAYHSAYAYLEHEAPGHHPFLRAYRFAWQEYGPGRRLINDNGMVEDPFGLGVETQGLPPYPYEADVTIPTSLRYPCPCVIEFAHIRGDVRGNRHSSRQLLQRVTIPGAEPGNPNVKWYYQLRGDFVALNSGQPIAALTVSAMHPAYAFRIQGVP